MSDLPSGTVTFLFTDIEGSTRLWEQRPEAMRLALAQHDALLRAGIEGHRGLVFKTMGDAFCAVFASASDALLAAFACQQSLLRQDWGELEELRVRMALHTGSAELRDNDYFGPPLNRTARLLSIAHGGQTLLSEATRSLLGAALPSEISLLDLGLHRLKDLQQPEHVFQLCHPALPGDFPALRSLDPLRHNLPVQLTSFVGREKEVADIKNLLANARLLTLTGSGGVGKTRLALQVAADLLDEIPDGIWLVELAPLVNSALVPQAVASALGLREEIGRSLSETLTDTLKAKQLLLLLDNCEHLLSACARLADTLLRFCPDVRILATSREALGIAGERLYLVPTLSLPAPREITSAGQLLQYEAAHLFVERANAVIPGFAVTSANAAALAQVCRQLDGIPLAIELAAARVRAMPVKQLASRLHDRFRLLTGGSRAALPRQQTLRALVDWSYDLLNPEEQRMLCHLSVFAGGWTLEAAEQVCLFAENEAWQALDWLTSLVDKSLVIYEAGVVRYRMLETVRQYARERLQERGEEESIGDRHRDYILRLAEEAKAQFTGPEQADWLQRLETEHENCRAAIAWSLSSANGLVAALRLTAALHGFWYRRGYLTEGREHLAAALARREEALEEDAQELANALRASGTLAAAQDDYASAQRFFAESLPYDRKKGSKSQVAATLINLGYIAHEQGDYAQAQQFAEEGLALFRELGQKPSIALALNNLGRIPADQGDYSRARPLYEESLALQRELNNTHGMAISLNNLGLLACYQGDYPRANALHQESLAIRKELGDKQGVGISLTDMASDFL